MATIGARRVLGWPRQRLKSSCEVLLAPFSVSREYARFARADGRDWRLLAELFTMLKRAGTSQMITYADASLAEALG